MSSKRERKMIYLTPQWRAVREEALERDGYCCVACRKIGLTVAADIVHHIRHVRKGGDHFDLDNLESLCRRCHKAEHAPTLPPERLAWQSLVAQTMEELPCASL